MERYFFLTLLLVTGCGQSITNIDSDPIVVYVDHVCGKHYKTFEYAPELISEICYNTQPVMGCAPPVGIVIVMNLTDEYKCQAVLHECYHHKHHDETGDWDYSHIGPDWEGIPAACSGWHKAEDSQ